MFGRLFSKNKQTAASAPPWQETPEDFVRMLGRVPLFLDLSRRELQRLGATCRQRQYGASEVLMRQGDPGAGLFIIMSGRVKIDHLQADGTVQEIRTEDPGEVIGEMSLLDDLPRSATVTALEPTRVLQVPIFDFRAALREDADISIKLLAVLSRRLRQAESRQI
ncbi:MAG TPA: Crp/Fnr family transcriptional regulator [Ktedonobacterales bacterium]|jgi:CRP/FNR family transcriptional regulator|nr:Crp/Fnr family transcriptional regulator [Ktedonobacterales bacterium]